MATPENGEMFSRSECYSRYEKANWLKRKCQWKGKTARAARLAKLEDHWHEEWQKWVRADTEAALAGCFD